MPQMSLQNKILCISFGIFLILYFIINRETPVKQNHGEEAASADTFIPPGHVLVPIQIENSESLNAVMGPFAIVDLYSVDSGHNTLVAEKVKLIRAPLNPQQYAVLVSDGLSKTIMQSKSSFSVVLQNRSVFKADLEKNLMADTDDRPKLNTKVVTQNRETNADTSSVRKTLVPQIRIEYQQRRL